MISSVLKQQDVEFPKVQHHSGIFWRAMKWELTPGGLDSQGLHFLCSLASLPLRLVFVSDRFLL